MYQMMYEKVKHFMNEHSMIESEDVVIAGISGGADSIAMLDILKHFCDEKNALLVAVHVNHGIRGKEALLDQEYVECFCRQNHITYHTYRYDVPKLSKKWKIGEEETGRILRKKAFEETAERYIEKKIKIAVAHNENDQAETVLHHLCRGSGMRGLGAIRPVTSERRYNYIRPLLCVQRREIENYLNDRDIQYRIDSSNLTDDYTRNRIRNNILPAIEKQINRQAVTHIAQMSVTMREADEFFSLRTKEQIKKCQFYEGVQYLIPETLISSISQIEKKYLIRELLGLLAGKKKDITSQHIESVLSLFELETGKKRALPYHINALKTYEGVLLTRLQNETLMDTDKNENPLSVWKLNVSGKIQCAAGRFECKIFQYSGQEIPRNRYTKWFDCDKINGTLKVRFRQTGDFIFIEPDNTRKKITRIMIDDKIPSKERGKIPLIALEHEIIWIVGGRISGKYKVSPTTNKILEISYTGEDEQ